MSLLLVHTDSDEREMYAEYFREEGFAVQEVGTTEGALPLARDARAVITGLMVPGSIDPIEFIEDVRRERPTTPIIVVTSCLVPHRIDEAYAAGANLVLTKPCLPDALLLAVREVIARRVA